MKGDSHHLDRHSRRSLDIINITLNEYRKTVRRVRGTTNYYIIIDHGKLNKPGSNKLLYSIENPKLRRLLNIPKIMELYVFIINKSLSHIRQHTNNTVVFVFEINRPLMRT